ncbi:hypothetical protein COO60DRAFT_452880 [Scenedesmus sp. NREL 46B-D3]|nr:hypothetical protein COO60DRAFT_452880 [Scenedesmus sp. NREL 46B-D3]
MQCYRSAPCLRPASQARHHELGTPHAARIRSSEWLRHQIPRAASIEQASSSSTKQETAAAQKAASSQLTVYFREEDVTVTAAAGEDLVDVAQRGGVAIPTGCWQGNCGVCEVEVFKYSGDADKDSSAGSSPAVVRACITKLPPGYSRVEVAQMQDAIWGLDGFDT